MQGYESEGLQPRAQFSHLKAYFFMQTDILTCMATNLQDRKSVV